VVGVAALVLVQEQQELQTQAVAVVAVLMDKMAAWVALVS